MGDCDQIFGRRHRPRRPHAGHKCAMRLGACTHTFRRVIACLQTLYAPVQSRSYGRGETTTAVTLRVTAGSALGRSLIGVKYLAQSILAPRPSRSQGYGSPVGVGVGVGVGVAIANSFSCKTTGR